MSHVVSFRFWRINIISNIFRTFHIVLEENYIAIIIVIELSPSPSCLHMMSLLWDSGSCRLQTQVYKPFFPAFFSQFLDFSPYEQHIFIHDESSLCFLGLVDLSIHKQQFLLLIPMEKKITSCPPAAFHASSESRVIFSSIILLNYRSCSPKS